MRAARSFCLRNSDSITSSIVRRSSSSERENKRFHDEFLDIAITYKIEWERELARRERLGITGGEEPLPHPDHVVVNMRTGEVSIKGPATKEEKERYDLFAKGKLEFTAELKELEQLLVEEPQYRAQILADIEHTKKMLEIVKRVSPD